MKNIYLFFIAILFCLFLNSDISFANKSSTLYTNNNNIGIGTTTPITELQVIGTTTTTGLVVEQGMVSPNLIVAGTITAGGLEVGGIITTSLIQVSGTVTAAEAQVTGTVTANVFSGNGSGFGGSLISGGTGKFVDGYLATDAVYTRGNVGVGKIFPEHTFDVQGDFHVTNFGGDLFVGTGGSKTTVGSYTVHTFSGGEVGTFTASGIARVEVLVVGGGGGGGDFGSTPQGAGGGAGGLIHHDVFLTTTGTYTVSVGVGGSPNNNGSDTVFGSLVAFGGGAGGNPNSINGKPGGSGGGGSTSFPTQGLAGTGTVGQGNDGGAGEATGNAGTGGGGGAGAAGLGATAQGDGGDGGVGLQFSTSGFASYYAGGGAGCRRQTERSNGSGGTGGGGGCGVDGTDGTGGGGGGADEFGLSDAGDGGDGIVLVRYLTDATFVIDPTKGFFIDENTKVGIGTSTPATLLHVLGTVTALGFVGNGSALTGIPAGGDFSNGGDVAGADRTLGNSDNFSLDIITNGASAIRLASSGDIGIGETVPLGKLHVKTADVGTIAGGITGEADELVLENTAGSGVTVISGTANQGYVMFGDSGDSNKGSLRYDHFDDAMRFFVNSAEAMRIDSGGNVNISGLTASSDVQTDGSKNLISVSDSSMKNDLGIILANSTNLIKQLTPHYWNFKHDVEAFMARGSSTSNLKTLGFFADEVNLIIPEAAPYEAERGLYGFNSNAIIAHLVKAIKELDARILILEAKP